MSYNIEMSSLFMFASPLLCVSKTKTKIQIEIEIEITTRPIVVNPMCRYGKIC